MIFIPNQNFYTAIDKSMALAAYDKFDIQWQWVFAMVWKATFKLIKKAL